MIRNIALAATAALTISIPSGSGAFAQAQPYTSMAGTWKGEQVRSNGLKRGMTIVIQPNGSYVWTADDGFSTNGQLSGAAGNVTYANGAGSRGAVTASARRLVWKNTMTGNNYTVTVSR